MVLASRASSGDCLPLRRLKALPGDESEDMLLKRKLANATSGALSSHKRSDRRSSFRNKKTLII